MLTAKAKRRLPGTAALVGIAVLLAALTTTAPPVTPDAPRAEVSR